MNKQIIKEKWNKHIITLELLKKLLDIEDNETIVNIGLDVNTLNHVVIETKEE